MWNNVSDAFTSFVRGLRGKGAASTSFRPYMFASQKFAKDYYLQLKNKVKEIISMYTTKPVLDIVVTILWVCDDSYLVGVDSLSDGKNYVIFYSSSVMDIVNNMNLASVNLNSNVSCEVYDSNYLVYVFSKSHAVKSPSLVIANESFFVKAMVNIMKSLEDKCNVLVSDERFVQSRSYDEFRDKRVDKALYARGAANKSALGRLDIDSTSGFGVDSNVADDRDLHNLDGGLAYGGDVVGNATKKSQAVVDYERYVSLLGGDMMTFEGIYTAVREYSGPYSRYIRSFLSSVDIDNIKHYCILGKCFDVNEYHNLLFTGGGFVLVGLRNLRVDNVLIFLLRQSFFFLKSLGAVSALLSNLLSSDTYSDHNCGGLPVSVLRQLFVLVCLWEITMFIDRYYDDSEVYEPLVLYNEDKVLRPCVKDHIKSLRGDYYCIYSLYKSGNVTFSESIGMMLDFVSYVLS